MRGSTAADSCSSPAAPPPPPPAPPASPARPRSRPTAAPAPIKDVEHIVVLMQENRSFDHYFGTLRGVRGFGDPRPVELPSGKPVWHQSDGTRRRPAVPARRRRPRPAVPRGPRRTAGPTATQAVQQRASTTSGSRPRPPTTMALPDAARTSRSTTRSPTRSPSATPTTARSSARPTRTATTCGPGWTGNDGKGGGPVLDNDEAGYDWTTYPERLEQAGVSWKIYQDIGDGLDAAGSWGWTDDAYIGNYGDNSLLYFNQYRTPQPGEPAVREGPHRHRTRKTRRGLLRHAARPTSQAGKLPQVSWIVAPEAFTEHPQLAGQLRRLVHLAGARRAHRQPEVWSKTALFITYDENDGFFDHVVPPYPPASAAPGRVHRRRRPTSSSPAAAATRAGPYGLGPARADDRRLAVEQGRLGLLGDLRPHLDHPVHGEALRRARSRTSRRGAARSAAT